MELLKKNYLDTTTMLVVGSNTATGAYLMDLDQTYQYVTSGFNNDATTASIRINFSETLTVSRIALMGVNLKKFTIFYNGSTANTFALTATCSTNSSAFLNNSETSLFLTCNPIDCTSVTIDMYSTQVANAEKAVGYLLVTKEHLAFSRPPSAGNYRPNIRQKQVVHEMSDGTKRVHTIYERNSVELTFDYLDTATRNTLKTLYKLHDGMVFAAFPTSAGWDEFLFPCVWTGAFEFLRFSDDAVSSGFSGSITLEETSL